MREIAASYVDWSSMWNVLLVSVIAGVGLVTVFAVGLAALSASGFVREPDAEGPVHHNIAALVAAVFCALVVVAAIVYGIHAILAKR